MTIEEGIQREVEKARRDTRWAWECSDLADSLSFRSPRYREDRAMWDAFGWVLKGRADVLEEVLMDLFGMEGWR